jgi:GDP-D-mannose 3',5'-epimerase
MIAGKKILITGASGFIGSYLAKRLEKNNSVLATSRQNGYNFTKYEDCWRATYGVDYVFDLAAAMGGIKYITENAADVIMHNSTINFNMIRASLENKVKKYFFPSSFCVYPGFLQGPSAIPLKESDAIPSYPDTDYGWEKLFIEQVLRSLNDAGKIETRVARMITIYGPGMQYKHGNEKFVSAICRKVAMAKNGEGIEIWGDGTTIRSLCYIEDCLDAFELIMESPYSEPFNIGYKESISINEVVDYAIEFSGKKLFKNYINKGVKGVDARLADVEKIKEKLGWEAKIDNRTGIKFLYDWIAEDINKNE